MIENMKIVIVTLLFFINGMSKIMFFIVEWQVWHLAVNAQARPVTVKSLLKIFILQIKNVSGKENTSLC